MKNGHEDKLEQRIRFVTKYYRENAIDADKAWREFSAEKGIKQRRFALPHYWQAIAAAILVCVAVSTWYIMDSTREEWLVVMTEQGQVKKLLLPDSSMVVIAGNSTVKYNLIAFKKGSREVEMKGKAFFQVKRDVGSPFSVSTTKTVVRVLGTSFQLDEKQNSTELYVSAGKVAFLAKDGDGEMILTKGMSAVYQEEDGVIIPNPDDRTNVFSWQTKKLHFNNTSLEDVIRDLTDYYQVEIVNRLDNGNKHLTASFNDLPLEETLLIINQTLDVHLVVQPAN
jgi:Fe2+-dicitrate sensor, membrane component